MKFTSTVAALAVATSVSAWYNDTAPVVSYTTKVVDVYETVCPAGSTITYGGSTYVNTETVSSTITITNCPCTVSVPVYTTAAVPTTAPAAPVYPNATTPAPTEYPTTAPGGVVGTTYVPAPSSTIVPASGANKAIAMSGASLAGLLGLAAYLL